MAGYNEIQVGRWNRLAQKLFGIKGGRTVDTLEASMGFALPVFHGVENRYLESWNRFGFGTGPTGGGGQFAGARFRNPVGSNLLCVIEQLIIIATSTGDNFRAQYASISTDLTTLSSPFRLDARGSPNSSLNVSSTVNAAFAGSALWNIQMTANTPFQVISDENQELPILPGDALTIVGSTFAVQILINAIWRERFLEDSERT